MYQKNKTMYIKQNLGQNVHVSISKKIFLIQILIGNKNHNPMLMINGTLLDNVQHIRANES